ncbi:MAG: hypothetical protein H6P99_985 [Holophagaceae bacterium]|nr:hypothetical protein [Holophagaceae bacterium]
MPRAFLRAEWRDLLLVTFQVDSDVLRPLLPPGVEPEPFAGNFYLSLVGFQFLKTRILGLPAPFHGAFPEVNLRTYVTARVNGQKRSGVVFLRELVPRSLVTLIARWGYGEPYQTVPLSHPRQSATAAEPASSMFRWTECGEIRGFEATPCSASLDASGLDTFLVNHLWGFANRFGTTLAYEVSRPPWQLSRAEHFKWIGGPSAAFPPSVLNVLSTEPASLLHTEGSPISVGFPKRVES